MSSPMKRASVASIGPQPSNCTNASAAGNNIASDVPTKGTNRSIAATNPHSGA